MIGYYSLKVPGGKLVNAEVEYSAKITSVKITGDFFMHPEDTLAKIEQAFEGLEKDFDAGKTEQKLEGLVKKEGAELIGFTAKDIVKVVKEAMK